MGMIFWDGSLATASNCATRASKCFASRSRRTRSRARHLPVGRRLIVWVRLDLRVGRAVDHAIHPDDGFLSRLFAQRRFVREVGNLLLKPAFCKQVERAAAVFDIFEDSEDAPFVFGHEPSRPTLARRTRLG